MYCMPVLLFSWRVNKQKNNSYDKNSHFSLEFQIRCSIREMLFVNLFDTLDKKIYLPVGITSPFVMPHFFPLDKKGKRK